MLDRLSGVSEFGYWFALIGWNWRRSSPQTEAADPAIRSNDESDMTDRVGQSQVCRAVVVPAMRTELQHRQKDCNADLFYHLTEYESLPSEVGEEPPMSPNSIWSWFFEPPPRGSEDKFGSDRSLESSLEGERSGFKEDQDLEDRIS